MNRLTKLLLLVVVLSFTSRLSADDRWETLRAINWVENPTNHSKMGRYGELGPYQFRPTTWRMHSKRPFSEAVLRAAADEVAIKHYEWIKTNLERAGVHASPFNIAMAWNSGVNNVLKGKVPSVTYNYAERVTNLVETFKQHAAPRVQASPTVAATTVPPAPRFSLEAPMVSFVTPEAASAAPKFDLVLPPPPPEPVVYTSREPATVSEGHRFTFSTTATLTPRFNLPGLLE